MKDLISILSDSPKWCAYFVGEYPNEYAHFTYVPYLEPISFLRIAIPLAPGGERRPNYDKQWVARVALSDNTGMVYYYFENEAKKNMQVFTECLSRLIAECNSKLCLDQYIKKAYAG